LVLTIDSLYSFSNDRWTYNGRNPLTNLQTVVSGIPGGGHDTRQMEFGKDDDWLYVHIGANGNLDTNSDRARVNRAHLNSATTLPITWDSMELFADGLRNEVGLRMDPRNRLWGVENGIDNLARFTTSPPLYVTNPAEEVNIFTQENAGKHYGYPYCWSEGIGESGNALSFNGGLGNGTVWATSSESSMYTDAWCRTNTVPCAWALQAHSAPLDIYFDNSTIFEAGHVAHIAEHGSWNRPDNFRAGFRVEYLRLNEHYDVLGKELLVQFPQDYTTRPVSIVRGPCSAYGSCLFVTDDSTNSIFAIVKETSITPNAPHPTAGPELVPLQGNTVFVNDQLTLSWSIRNGELITGIVHSGAQGWFAAGWSLENSMNGVVVISLDGVTAGTVDVSVRDGGIIMESWNTASTNWGFHDIQSRLQNGDQIMTFKRPIKCPEGAASSCFDIPVDGETGVYFIFAYHNDQYGFVINGTLPRHSDTARNGPIKMVVGAEPSVRASHASHRSSIGAIVYSLLGFFFLMVR
jgi:glucose/arabinose dehydrogenase